MFIKIKKNKKSILFLFLKISFSKELKVNRLIKKYLNKELKKVIVGQSEKTNKGITHQVIEVIAEEKLALLLHHLTQFGKERGIIFCRTKSGVQKLYKQLSAKKIACVDIQGVFGLHL